MRKHIFYLRHPPSGVVLCQPKQTNTTRGKQRKKGKKKKRKEEIRKKKRGREGREN